MYIPKKMSKKISDVFYDKTVYILIKKNEVDAEGGTSIKVDPNEFTDTFKGNVNFSNCKLIQEEYGLDYNIDISITTLNSTKIKTNDIIKYNSVIYNVTDVIVKDSHIRVVAEKWRH
ncbi:MAG: hypothetical protein RR557_05505 [Bacilli bacterium]